MARANDFHKMPEGFDFGQAIAEADRCLLCHDAPCSKACPADTKPGEFIRKFRLKNITGAIRTIKQNNILGGACGVLCPTERLCEKECSAKLGSIGHPEDRDNPVQIGKLQRFLVEQSWEMDFNAFTPRSKKEERVAIVGSGPAGLSCAAELAKNGYQTTVFEARSEAGGMIRYGVVPFRFDLDFLKREMADIEALGVEFKFNAPINSPGKVEQLLAEDYDAVFIATGLWKGTRLKTGENLPEGVFDAIDYLSGLRDGQLASFQASIKGKVTAVVGGGATAMDCVESAIRLGASDVYLIYRRSYLQMPAEKPERIHSLDAGVHYLLLNQPTDYILDPQNQLKGLKLIRTRLAEADESGRRKPVEITGSEWVLDVDVVIEAIGNKSDDASPGWYPNVRVDENKLILVDEKTGETSVKGIFAGGDIIRGPGLVVKAVQDGKRAARAIENYFGNKEEPV